MLTDETGQMEEAKTNHWERCGCTVKCGRLKRRNEANVHVSPTNTGASIDTSRQKMRRYSQDRDRTDLISSQCRSVSCGTTNDRICKYTKDTEVVSPQDNDEGKKKKRA